MSMYMYVSGIMIRLFGPRFSFKLIFIYFFHSDHPGQHTSKFLIQLLIGYIFFSNLPVNLMASSQVIGLMNVFIDKHGEKLMIIC